MRAVIGIRNALASASDCSQPTPTVWFDSMRQMAGVLSDENRDLLRLIHDASHAPCWSWLSGQVGPPATCRARCAIWKATVWCA